MADSALWHFFKNLSLLCLSLLVLPFDTTIIAAIYIWNKLSQSSSHHELPDDQRKSVLITGVSMTKGLTLARLFHHSGHRVIGADFQTLSLGRVSSAIHKFHALPAPREIQRGGDGRYDPYILGILSIVKTENVDLWISVSDVNAAVHDALATDLIESETTAKSIQFKLEDIRTLHEKDLFMKHTEALGLLKPDAQVVTSKDLIIEFLSKRGGLTLQPEGQQFILKPVGVNDLDRFDMPLLPLATEQATRDRIDSVPFQHGDFILQEFIQGSEYCTHSLVVDGQVRAFVACPSSELLMHYTALPAESPLSQAMLEFTQIQAASGGQNYTGHLSFDFLVKHRYNGKNGQVQLYPIECNPRVHTAVVLFNNTPALVDAYLSALSIKPQNHLGGPIAPRQPRQYYWVGQDAVELVVYPLFLFLVGSLTRSQLSERFQLFAHHVKHCKDGVFEVWDPWPWWWVHHVYWPLQLLQYLVRGRWHKINISTNKAFRAE